MGWPTPAVRVASLAAIETLRASFGSEAPAPVAGLIGAIDLANREVVGTGARPRTPDSGAWAPTVTVIAPGAGGGRGSRRPSPTSATPAPTSCATASWGMLTDGPQRGPSSWCARVGSPLKEAAVHPPAPRAEPELLGMAPRGPTSTATRSCPSGATATSCAATASSTRSVDDGHRLGAAAASPNLRRPWTKLVAMARGRGVVTTNINRGPGRRGRLTITGPSRRRPRAVG